MRTRVRMNFQIKSVFKSYRDAYRQNSRAPGSAVRSGALIGERASVFFIEGNNVYLKQKEKKKIGGRRHRRQELVAPPRRRRRRRRKRITLPKPKTPARYLRPVQLPARRVSGD